MASGSYLRSFSRVGMDSGTGICVVILRYFVSTRGTARGTNSQAFAMGHFLLIKEPEINRSRAHAFAMPALRSRLMRFFSDRGCIAVSFAQMGFSPSRFPVKLLPMRWEHQTPE